jgi:hypothetical protein
MIDWVVAVHSFTFEFVVTETQNLIPENSEIPQDVLRPTTELC